METSDLTSSPLPLPLIDQREFLRYQPDSAITKSKRRLRNFVNTMTKAMRLANPTPNREEQVTCPH
jgi:hypothetical protein